MTIRRILAIVVLAAIAVIPTRSWAGWPLTLADWLCKPGIAMEGDYLAYIFMDTVDYREEVTLLNISSGEKKDLSEDLVPAPKMVCALKDGKVWFYSSTYEPRSSSLYKYDIQSGELSEEVTTQDGYVNFGDVQEDNLVVELNNDYWLYAPGQQRQLTFSGANIEKNEEFLAGDYLVWGGYQEHSGPWHIYLTDIRNGHTEQLTPDEQGVHRGLCLDGDYAVWEWRREVYGSGDKRFYLYDIPNRKTHVLATSENGTRITSAQIDIEYPRVVYVQASGSQWTLMLYDISTQQSQALWTTDIRIHSPRIRHNEIIYVGYNCAHNDCQELYHFDLDTHALEQITTLGEDHSFRDPIWVEDGWVAFFSVWLTPPLGQVYLARRGNSVPPSWGIPASVVQNQADSSPDSLICFLLLLVVPWMLVLIWKARRAL